MLELLDLPTDILLHITKLVAAINDDTSLVTLHGICYLLEPDLSLRLTCQRLNKLCKDSHRDAWFPVKVVTSVPRSMCIYRVVPIITTNATRMQQMERELGVLPQISISGKARSKDGKKQPLETSIVIISLHHAMKYSGFLRAQQAASVPGEVRSRLSEDACHLSLRLDLEVPDKFSRSISQEYLDGAPRKAQLLAMLYKMRHPDNLFLGMVPDNLNDSIEWSQCRQGDIQALRGEREALYQLLLQREGGATGLHDHIYQRLLELTACYLEFIRTSISTGTCSSSKLRAYLNELLQLAYDLKVVGAGTFVDADPIWPIGTLPRCEDCDDDTPCYDVLLRDLGQTQPKLDSRIEMYWAAKQAVEHNIPRHGDILLFQLERAYEELSEVALGIERKFGTRLASVDRQLKVLCQLCDEVRTRERLKGQNKLESGASRFVWTAEEDQIYGDDDLGSLVRARLDVGERLLYMQGFNEAIEDGSL